MSRGSPRAGSLDWQELAGLIVLAQRIASRLEAAGGDEYLRRLARAQALALSDALSELADGSRGADPIPSGLLRDVQARVGPRDQGGGVVVRRADLPERRDADADRDVDRRTTGAHP